MKTNTKGWSAKAENDKEEAKKAQKIHNLIIVDESGSMRMLYEEALSGMNETLQTIKQDSAENPEIPQEVTLVTFDSEHYKELFHEMRTEEIRTITTADYQPCGCTPLYDAIGRAVSTLRRHVKDDEAVLVTIITDGLENASCEYTLAEIKRMIEELSKKGWLFSYIGANQDAVAVGKSMAINASLNFEYTPDGMNQMWAKEKNSRKAFYSRHRTEGFKASENMNKEDFFENF